MQLTSKIKNNSTTWTAKLRPRVGSVVTDGTNYYENIAGYNDVLTNLLVWLPIGQVSTSMPGVMTINSTSGSYSGTDPFWYLPLSGMGLPSFPSTFTVYIDQAGTGAWKKLGSPDYDPIAQQLNGMDKPSDFPSEKIKILYS